MKTKKFTEELRAMTAEELNAKLKELKEELLKASGQKKVRIIKRLEIVEASVSNSNEVQQVVTSLEGKVDAIYAPTDNTIAAAMPTVAAAAVPAGIPVICGEAGMVEAGGVATYALDYYNLGKMTAQQAVKILVDGEDISKMAIEYAAGDELKYAVNKAIADQLNLTIPAEILDNATIFE
mgnify:CR=1 FL=1